MSKNFKYVVLLRGVNVGGNRLLRKEDFKLVLESLGFRDVVIYINSGNAVFSSKTKPSVLKIQKALEDFCKFPVMALLISAEQMKAISDAIPSNWTNDTLNNEKTGFKSDVIFLFNSVNNRQILQKIGYKPEIETMKYVEGAVISNISRKNQQRGSLQKLISNKSIYNNITIRNINTVKKLTELANS